MNAANKTKNQLRLTTSSLKNGNTSEVENGVWPSWTSMTQAVPAISVSIAKRVRPAKPLWVCFLTFR